MLGTAGVSKLDYINEVRRVACKKNIVPGGAKSKLADKFLIVRDLDKKLEEVKGGHAHYGVYLAETDQDEQVKAWSNVCRNTLREIESAKPTHAFLLIHGVYFRNKTYRSILDMNLLRKFRPTVVLILIEDAYDVVARIKKKEKAAGTGSLCSFSEAIEWRTVETMVGNLLGRNLYQQHRVPVYVVARKHPPEMAYRLLFERWRLIVYTAFPISGIRYNQRAIDEINVFRSIVRKEFTTFDPVTIDEYPLTRPGGGKKPSLLRWPGLKSDVDGLRGMSVVDFKRLEGDIRKIIELRDYLLVDQSNCLVAYRPFYGKREAPSSGVDTEMVHCLDKEKPIFVVHDERTDGELTASRTMFKPIETATAIKPTVKEILREIRLTQHEKSEVWEREGRAATWE